MHVNPLRPQPAWMLVLLFILSFVSGPLRAGYPAPTDDYVNDFADVLSDHDRVRIKEALARLERQTGIEGVAVTIPSIREYDTGAINVSAFATGLFNDWGVGHRARNNGFMILLSVEDRESRIELGDGFGHVLNDRMQDVMARDMMPHFRERDYSRGVHDGVMGVMAAVTRPVSWFEYHKWNLAMGAGAFVLVLMGISLIRSGRSGWGYACLAAAAALIMMILANRSKSVGGFGGGRSSGGGGASGKW